MSDIYIIDGYRTPVGTFGGNLANFSATDLGVFAVKGLLEKTGVKTELIDEVIAGNVVQAGTGQNVARQIAVKSGIAVEKTALTLNMACGSAMRAMVSAAQNIMSGDSVFSIAGGTESMSNAPYLIRKARYGVKLGHSELTDSLLSDGLHDAFENIHMGITAENIAKKYSISRKEQDAFAALSQQKAENAIKAGRFNTEIIPIIIPQKNKDPLIINNDEHPRFGTTEESLAKLRPAFKQDGTVTAGNASGINDGAAFVLMCNAETAKKHNLTPKAKLVSWASHGVDPNIMGMGPVEAVKKALTKANWKMSDVELIEANEAFAAQALGVAKELNFSTDILNVNGGAIALGHPIGASGARIVVTLMHEMSRRKVKKGLATLCIGGGMGIAVCIEML